MSGISELGKKLIFVSLEIVFVAECEEDEEEQGTKQKQERWIRISARRVEAQSRDRLDHVEDGVRITRTPMAREGRAKWARRAPGESHCFSLLLELLVSLPLR